MKNNKIFNAIFLLLVAILFGYYSYLEYVNNKEYSYSFDYKSITNISDYNGEDIIILNNNEPQFNLNKIKISKSFEKYGEFDSLGRCTTAYSNIGYDLMPSQKRESISQIRPTGFKIKKYSIIEDGYYLYNRCHLIGYQLTGENANPNNLITCTRHMNVDLMEPYENMVSSYIRKTKNHVLYRVTPFFKGKNLVSSGVKIEALSLEDNGDGIKFNVFIYNVQPGIEIDYENGNSKLIE